MSYFISTTANTTVDEFVFNTLRCLIFAMIIFNGCKFCHILREFIFADDEILIILCGLISAVVRYEMFMSSDNSGEKQQQKEPNFCSHEHVCTN